VFSVGPASTFVLFRRFRIEPSWRAFARWTLAAGLVMTVGVLLLKVATLPPPASPNDLTRFVGVIQRVVIVTLMSWVASLGVSMLRRGRTTPPPSNPSR
jgi:Na+/proline symporter